MAGFVIDCTETDGCVQTEHLERNINVRYCCRFTRTTLDLDSVCKAPNLCDSLAEKASRYCQYNMSIAVHQSPYVWCSIYNTPAVTFRHSSNQTEHKTK